MRKKRRLLTWSLSVMLFNLTLIGLMAADKPLILQELTWTDIKSYLKTNDMVIIPLGSTEQHGPHLPLGTDFYEAFGLSKMISAQTGVLVAPLTFTGYSPYHSGFPGTLSLQPETMERVIFESVEWLLKYGFRRFLFFNYHGGNNIVQTRVIHRINHQTPGIAVAIGHGSSLQSEEEEPPKSLLFCWCGALCWGFLKKQAKEGPAMNFLPTESGRSSTPVKLRPNEEKKKP